MRFSLVGRHAVWAGVLALSGARRDAARAPASTPGVVQVSVRPVAISAPDSLPAGWTRVRIEESGGEHIVVVFRPTTASASAVTAFFAALDTAPVTPRPGVTLGGLEVGAQGEVIAHVTPA